VSLRQIADKAGVSVSTVSRALSGNARISEEKRRQILEIARAEGYVDNRIRKATQAGLHSIALAVPEELLRPSETNYASWRILESLSADCRARGIRIDPVLCPGDRLDPARVMQGLAGSDAEGVLIFFDENPDLLARLAGLDRPVVLLFGLDPSSQVSSVGVGNSFAASLGTRTLLDMGHRDILLVSWPGRTTIRRREAGYREAMREHGLEPGPDAVLRLSGFEPALAEAEFGRWLDVRGGHPGATAIFCLSDNIALGVMAALKARGIAIPGEVSVLGFDDSVAGQMALPALSSVHPPLEHIAGTALDELELHLRRMDRHPPRRIELGCSVSLRDSCAPPARTPR